MEHPVGEQLKRPELVGRDRELDFLETSLRHASDGRGSTTFIAGEAGVGKTRLVSELTGRAESAGFKVLNGWCLAESLEPLMPVREMLRSGGLHHLISGAPPPMVLSAYLISRSGLLVAEVQRQESGVDPDIFAGMLQAVSSFVKDSLGGMLAPGGGLNSLGYGDFTILIQSSKELSLAAVIKGERSEFLIEDMKRTLADLGDSLDGWSGNMAAAESAVPRIAWYVKSGKYDGRFLVDDPRLRQENLFDNILLGLQRASGEAPLLIFVDDLQWADPTTLTLLHYLARNMRSSRVLLLGTYRPEDLVAGDGGKPHHLVTTMQNMTREDLLSKVELARLDRDAARALMESALGATGLDPSFGSMVHKESGGTPFFVLELLRLLIEERVIERDASGAWRVVKAGKEMSVPSKVYDVVKRRLDRLPAEQVQLLECASVIGEEFQTPILERVSGVGRLALLRSLGDIEKAHRLVRYGGERYRFDHAKIRDVLYGGIPDELRMEYHRLVGDAIASLGQGAEGPAVAELAYHYHRARDPRAAGYLVKAADIARAGFANEGAVRLYSDAIPMLAGQERLAAIESLADVQTIMGIHDGALANLEAAAGLAGDPETRARLGRKRAEVIQRTGDFDGVLAQVAAARAELAGSGGLEPGRLSICEAAAYIKKGQYGDALRSLGEAKAVFGRAPGSEAELSAVSRLIGNVHWNRAEYKEALEHYERSLAESKGIANLIGDAMVLNNIGAVHQVHGETEKALEYCTRSLELRERIGEKSGIASSLNNVGIAYQNLADAEKALEFFMRGLAIREKIGDRRGESVSLLSIGIIHYDRGDLAQALDFYRRSLALAEVTGETSMIAILQTDIGLVHQDMGEPEKALRCHEDALGIFESIGEPRGVANSLCGMSEANIMLGRTEQAVDCAEKALAASSKIGAQKEEGLSRRVLGMALRQAGRLEDAAAELGAAERLLQSIKNRKEAARVRLEMGLLSLAMGRTEEARQVLHEALSEFEALGLKMRAREAGAALERMG